MKSTHPKPLLNRVTQYGAVLLVGVMLLAAVLQIVLALAIRPGVIFVASALMTMLLIPFVLMLTASTPAVTIAPEGITIEPLIWKKQFIPWQEITTVKDYPLLPQTHTEATRKMATGRQHYRSAEGIMLVTPALPLQYRITGLLAGEGFTPVIALTNRTHTDYERLVSLVQRYTGGV